MDSLRFERLTGRDEILNGVFGALVFEYVNEMNQHSPRPLPKAYQQKWVDSMIAEQGEKEQVLEVCFLGDAAIGFCYGRIDGKQHPRPSWGYVLEFFIRPEWRRQGYGKTMLLRLEHALVSLGAKSIYLTADPVTGKPFWQRMGYQGTGEISAQTQMEIYEKREVH